MRAHLTRCTMVPSLALLAFTGSAAAQVSLDDFITRDRSCEGSAAYQAFAKSLNSPYNFDGPRSGRVVVPAELEKHFGSAKAKKASGLTDVAVPVLGAEYGGLPVRALNFFFGHSNGINVKTIAFSAEYATAERRIGAAVKRVNAKLQREMAEVSGADADYAKLQRHRSGSELLCDLST